ncbi:MAG: hypothetical protein HYY06_26025 [Deltaproteobacteria bacterium]|nr:hypothetical protein [Deltaproteobacteria bacterium]
MLASGVHVRALLVCFLWPAAAQGWTEARPLTAEARVQVEADGKAIVSYRIVFEIEAGSFRGFTLSGMPEDARMDQAASRAIEGSGATRPLRIRQGTRQDRGSFWIDLEGEHGVGRGQLVVELAWATRVEIERTDEGTIYGWATPPWGHGLGMVSASLDLPFPAARVRSVLDSFSAPQMHAPTRAEPGDERPGTEGTDLRGSQTVTARDAQHSRVTVSRFRLPRWTSLGVRALVEKDEIAPSRQPAGVAAGSLPAKRSLAARAAPFAPVGVAALVVLLGALKRLGTRGVARRAGAIALDVLPALGAVPRLALAAALVAAGFALGAWRPGWAAPGTAAILLGALLCARRFGVAVGARAPGTWIDLCPEAVAERIRQDVRRRRRLASVLDATCPRGAVLLTLLAGAAVAAALRLPEDEARLALLLPVDALALLVPLFLTGTRRQLPPDLGALSARMLARHGRRARNLLARAGGGELSIIGREIGGGAIDELRLRLVPFKAPEGLGAIELCTEVWCRTPTLAVLIRTRAGTAAHRLIPRLRGVVERYRSKDGSSCVAIIVPGPDGHAGLLRDLRHALLLFASSAEPEVKPTTLAAA